MKSRRVLPLLAIAASVLWGCSSPAAVPTTQTLSVSRAKIYQTIGALASDSAVVAVVRPTIDSHVETVAGTPFTVTTVKVVEVLSGEQVGSTLSLRQLGTADVRPEDWVQPVRSTADYLVFLQHFTFGPGRATQQFIVTGEPAGLFELQNGGAVRLDPESVALPAAFPLSDLRALLKK